MKHIVSYSGGIGSAITAKMLVEKYGKENVILLFADTNMEDEDLYRFNEDIKKLLGCEFIRIADGRDVWQVFEDVKFIGNSRIDPCSNILKRQLIKKYLKNNFDPEKCFIYVGIDCTEEHRLVRVVEGNKPFRYRSILIEEDIFIDQPYKIKWCKENNIEIPRMYIMGFPHNNCGGFCVKTGIANFKLLYEKFPERYRWHEERERQAMQRNPNLRPFLSRIENGQKRYMTMKEVREELLFTKSLELEDFFDFGGCGCALE